MTTIPLSALDGASEEVMAIVRREWPDGIPLTEEAAKRVAEFRLDFDWMARAAYDAATAHAILAACLEQEELNLEEATP